MADEFAQYKVSKPAPATDEFAAYKAARVPDGTSASDPQWNTGATFGGTLAKVLAAPVTSIMGVGPALMDWGQKVAAGKGLAFTGGASTEDMSPYNAGVMAVMAGAQPGDPNPPVGPWGRRLAAINHPEMMGPPPASTGPSTIGRLGGVAGDVTKDLVLDWLPHKISKSVLKSIEKRFPGAADVRDPYADLKSTRAPAPRYPAPSTAAKGMPPPPVTYPKAAQPTVFLAPPVTYPVAPAEATPKVYPAPRVTFQAPEVSPSYPAPPVRFPAPEAGPRPIAAPPVTYPAAEGTPKAYPAPRVTFPKPPVEPKAKVYPAPRVTFPKAPEAEASETAGSLPKGTTEADIQAALDKMRSAQRPPREPSPMPEGEASMPGSLATPPSEQVAPPGLPPPPEAGGRLYSKTKNPHQEITSQIHAQGREMELPGSPVGKKISVGPTAQEVYGKSWPELDIEQKSAINEFLQTNRRLPTAADVVSGLFRK